MKQEELNIYTDYLSVSFGQATATGLSKILEGEISHDRITRLLGTEEQGSKELWKKTKVTVREIEKVSGAVVFDDTIIEKEYMGENELICWHYDHSKSRNVKGMNLLNCLYQVDDISIPVGFALVKKPICYSEVKTKKVKRRSEVTKNEQVREMFDRCLENQIKFSWVLFDSWFGSSENMKHIKAHGKEFICALKTNRLVALNEQDYRNKNFTRVDQIQWSEQKVLTVWLKGINFPIRLTRQVFTNKDESTGFLYLACSLLDADWNQITTTYQKRWNVEVFHKSLKSNAALSKSPARRVNAQANHLFASILAVFNMEKLKIKSKLNHFALRSKLYLNAIQSAFQELQAFKQSILSA